MTGTRDTARNSRLDPDRLIAAVATLVAALLLSIFLLIIPVNFPSPAAPEKKSTLEMASIDPEEQEEFIEPVLLTDAGESDARETDAPAAAPDGTPDKADKPNDRRVVNGENPQPSPSQEKLVNTTAPSPRRTADPAPQERPDQRISDRMAGQFSPHNGRQGGSAQPGAQGTSAGAGSGAVGTLKGGRKLLSCPTPSVTLRQKVVIKVEVYVNAEGAVTEASVLSGSSDATLRQKCLQASLKARWTPKADAPCTRGVITWTLVPKI